jgi:pSer/pThr/pTyr-binding forkhead associated (FHA) protein
VAALREWLPPLSFAGSFPPLTLNRSACIPMATPEGTPAKRLALFAVQAGPRIGQEMPITSPRMAIGSGSQNDLVIEDDSVSTNHALLEYEHGGWRITDLDSTNGTFVEGIKLAPQVPTPLDYGSSVRVGGLRLHFREVQHVDLEAEKAAYVPVEREPTLAEKQSGFRMPLWMLVALVLVVLAVAVGVFVLMQPTGEPVGPAPAIEQTTTPAPQQPAPIAPPSAPPITDTLPADTVEPAVDTLQTPEQDDL